MGPDALLPYVTAGLQVRYLRPTPLNVPLSLRARPLEASESGITVAVELSCAGRFALRVQRCGSVGDRAPDNAVTSYSCCVAVTKSAHFCGRRQAPATARIASATAVGASSISRCAPSSTHARVGTDARQLRALPRNPGPLLVVPHLRTAATDQNGDRQRHRPRRRPCRQQLGAVAG